MPSGKIGLLEPNVGWSRLGAGFRSLWGRALFSSHVMTDNDDDTRCL